MPKITTFLTYDNQAEEAVSFYLSVFEAGTIVSTMRRGEGGPALSLTFELLGQTFIALNGGPSFSFSQGVSLFVGCETQAEIDRYWAKLSDGGKEIQCGWVTDKFGLTWQIVPNVLGELLGGKDAAGAGRAMQAMLRMKKLDIASLKRAYDAA
ncbi:MAG TPA: VOC family protein [Polyangiaceae bacterium]|nr:VOC family protein [Polyangiaceae bacterium]